MFLRLMLTARLAVRFLLAEANEFHFEISLQPFGLPPRGDICWRKWGSECSGVSRSSLSGPSGLQRCGIY